MKITPIINTIKNEAKALPEKTLKGVNSVGGATIKIKNNAKEFANKHLPMPNFVKNIKTPKFIKNVSEFISKNTSKALKNIKAPKFIQNASKFVKNNKEAFVGGAVIAAAVASAAAITKTVTDKIKETKPKDTTFAYKTVGKLNTHQG